MKTNKTLTGTGLIAAIASSLCCIVPVIAAIAGISGTASMFSWIEPARPYFIGFTVLALGLAWYMKFRPTKAMADDCCEKEPKQNFLSSSKFLAFVTLFAVLALTFPLYADIFYHRPQKQVISGQESKIFSAKLTISGMTCAGCESHVTGVLYKQAGIIEASASYEAGSATVKFDTSKTSLDIYAEIIEDETGYKVESYELINEKNDNITIHY